MLKFKDLGFYKDLLLQQQIKIGDKLADILQKVLQDVPSQEDEFKDFDQIDLHKEGEKYMKGQLDVTKNGKTQVNKIGRVLNKIYDNVTPAHMDSITYYIDRLNSSPTGDDDFEQEKDVVKVYRSRDIESCMSKEGSKTYTHTKLYSSQPNISAIVRINPEGRYETRAILWKDVVDDMGNKYWFLDRIYSNIRDDAGKLENYAHSKGWITKRDWETGSISKKNYKFRLQTRDLSKISPLPYLDTFKWFDPKDISLNTVGGHGRIDCASVSGVNISNYRQRSEFELSLPTKFDEYLQKYFYGKSRGFIILQIDKLEKTLKQFRYTPYQIITLYKGIGNGFQKNKKYFALNTNTGYFCTFDKYQQISEVISDSQLQNYYQFRLQLQRQEQENRNRNRNQKDKD